MAVKEKKTKKSKALPYDREEMRVLQLTKIYQGDYEPLTPLVMLPTEAGALEALQAATEIGFDIETLGTVEPKHALHPDLGEIRLLQAYLPEIDRAIIWDLGELENRLTPPGLDLLRSKLLSRKCIKYIHYAKFESSWINAKWQIPIFSVVDSLILSQLYWAGLSRGFASIGILKPNSLEQVVLRLFGESVDKADQQFDYALPVSNDQLNYAALDAKLTYRCGVALLALCEKEGLHHDRTDRPSVVKAEMTAIPAFAQLNFNGYPVDVKLMTEIKVQYEAAMQVAIAPWMAAFPDSNPGSWQQVLKCFAEAGIVNEQGKPFKSTGSEVINCVQEKYPLVKSLLLWRTVKKQLEYIDGKSGYLKKVSTVRGFTVVKSSFNQNADQVTGRSSSSSPNLQNVPTGTATLESLNLPPIRSAFRAPDGYKLIILDLEASHAQLARHLSQDPALLESALTGLKIHFYTISGMLKYKGVDLTPQECFSAYKDKEHPKHREVKNLYHPSKTVFYSGLNLGGGVRLQSTFAKFDPPMFLPLDVCKEYTDGFKVAYPRLCAYQKRVIATANQSRLYFKAQVDGEIKTVGSFQGCYGKARSLDGGIQYIEKLPSKYSEAWEVNAADAVAYGWLRLEGTIIKYAMGLIVQWLLLTGKDAWLCNFAHDEANIIVCENQAFEVAKYSLETINASFRAFVPDYVAESEDPNNYIKDKWSDK